MSGGTDISFLSNLRVPCGIILGVLLLLTILGVASCVSCMVTPSEPGAEPSELALTAA